MISTAADSRASSKTTILLSACGPVRRAALVWLGPSQRISTVATDETLVRAGRGLVHHREQILVARFFYFFVDWSGMSAAGVSRAGNSERQKRYRIASARPVPRQLRNPLRFRPGNRRSHRSLGQCRCALRGSARRGANISPPCRCDASLSGCDRSRIAAAGARARRVSADCLKASIRSARKPIGCGEVKRSRSSPSTSCTASSNCTNGLFPSRFGNSWRP